MAVVAKLDRVVFPLSLIHILASVTDHQLKQNMENIGSETREYCVHHYASASVFLHHIRTHSGKPKNTLCSSIVLILTSKETKIKKNIFHIDFLSEPKLIKMSYLSPYFLVYQLEIEISLSFANPKL